MNSKGVNRNVWALMLSLCLGLIGFSALSVQAADPLPQRSPLLLPKNPEVQATANCSCKVSCVNLTGQMNASFVCRDYGPIWQYQSIGFSSPQNESNQIDCQSRCKVKAGPDIGSPGVATACCNIGCGNGSTVVAYSAVSLMPYRAAENIGVLHSTPAVTTCKCPQGWSNANQQDGGVTAEGKCKKVACQPNIVSPYPADGTPIGSWGLSWGNAFYTWGTPANGGAPTCTTTPASCKF